ncbi:6-bladed beta-propeller [Viscerimonas tarda]
MKIKIYLLIVIFPVLSLSCKHKEEIREVGMDNSLVKTILIDPDDFDKKEPARISEIANGVEYIPLQTEDSILIGKIGKLIVRDNLFYLWDKLSETIFCFDSAGRFIHKIHKQGLGPEEYPRISDFTIDMKHGDIYIYSDMGQAFYKYTKEGYFIKKIPTTLIFSSFAVQEDDIFLCYTSQLPNASFYQQTFPEQYRYIVLHGNTIRNNQLKYTYTKKNSRVPLSNNNFSFYRDTILLTEYLKPEIYSIDSVGNLTPRYRIEFLTNKYHPSFDTDIDLKRMEDEKKSGDLTMLFNFFYETDNYVFMSYARGLVGLAYVNKRDNTVHNMGYFLYDNINQNSLSCSIDFVDNSYMYEITEPDILIRKHLASEEKISKHLQNVIAEIDEFANPIIVKIKLK